jgi:hypothetical protein
VSFLLLFKRLSATLLRGHTALAGWIFSNNTRALEQGGQPALMGFPRAGA